MSREIKTDRLVTPAIHLANGGVLIARNAANTADLPVVFMDGSDELIIGNDSSGSGFVLTDSGINVIVGGGTGTVDQLSDELFLQGGSHNAYLSFYDLTSTHKFTLTGFAGLTADSRWVLPNGNGSAGQVLGTDGANPANLSWVDQTGGGGGSASGVGINVPGITPTASTATQLLFTSADAPVDTDNYAATANTLTVPATTFYWLNINAQQTSGTGSDVLSFGYSTDGGVTITYFIGDSVDAGGSNPTITNGSQLLFLTSGAQLTLWALSQSGDPLSQITVGLAQTGGASGGSGGGDFTEFALTNNQASPVDVTGFALDHTVSQFYYFDVATYYNTTGTGATEGGFVGQFTAEYLTVAGTWNLTPLPSNGGYGVGDSSFAVSLTGAGQIQYVTGDVTTGGTTGTAVAAYNLFWAITKPGGGGSSSSPASGVSVAAPSFTTAGSNVDEQIVFTSIDAIFDTSTYTVVANGLTVPSTTLYTLSVTPQVASPSGTFECGYSINAGGITYMNVETTGTVTQPFTALLSLTALDVVKVWVNTQNSVSISPIRIDLVRQGGGSGGGGSGANQTLSNLTNPTAINQPLLFDPSIPDGSLIKLNHTYISPFDRGLYLSGELSLDSSGNWTYHGTNTDASFLAVNRDAPSLSFFTVTGTTDGTMCSPGLVWNVDVSGTVTQSGSLFPTVTDGSLALGDVANYWGQSQISALGDASGVVAISPFGRTLADAASVTSVDWQNKQLLNSAGASLDWSNGSILVPIRPVVFDSAGEFSTTGVTQSDLLIQTNNQTYATLGAGLNSGNLLIITGDTHDTGNTGTLSIGSGSSNSGGTGDTGNVSFGSGSTDGSGTTGNVLIASGDTPGTSGNLTLRTGVDGTRGRILFTDGSEGVAGYVWTSTDTGGTGAWVNPLVTPVRILGSGSNTVATTDYKLLCDTTDPSAATIILPTGVDGMTFKFSGVAGGAFNYTLTAAGGNGIDPSAPSVISAGSVVEYTFLATDWYAT